MINNLLFISLAPVLIIGFYIYNRDKYEKEPFSVLMKALFAGVIIVLPVVLVEKFLDQFNQGLEGLQSAAYVAFVEAAFTEEGMKFLAFYIFFRTERNFNEKFDGIVYAVYIALGFAGIENILYVFIGGVWCRTCPCPDRGAGSRALRNCNGILFRACPFHSAAADHL